MFSRRSFGAVDEGRKQINWVPAIIQRPCEELSAMVDTYLSLRTLHAAGRVRAGKKGGYAVRLKFTYVW
ncbi:MAG TPA: hypothetical protein PKD64_08200 [Pirellulaceae bacterium]|nr:hypothetical protein [Pirellulaceae bacterium]HMO92168.1 hypothetical protein [Pirellulaceae bacterium]HMP68905.1 hypothetical protein [Pirellulaceae bacterium]